jgi:hypothetical protein
VYFVYLDSYWLAKVINVDDDNKTLKYSTSMIISAMTRSYQYWGEGMSRFFGRCQDFYPTTQTLYFFVLLGEKKIFHD